MYSSSSIVEPENRARHRGEMLPSIVSSIVLRIVASIVASMLSSTCTVGVFTYHLQLHQRVVHLQHRTDHFLVLHRDHPCLSFPLLRPLFLPHIAGTGTAGAAGAAAAGAVVAVVLVHFHQRRCFFRVSSGPGCRLLLRTERREGASALALTL